MTLSLGKALAIIACVLFILAVFDVHLGTLNLIAGGLAFLAAAIAVDR